MSKKGPLDPNAAKALNEMRIEIARDLGVAEEVIGNSTASVYDLVRMGGEVGGNMTRKLVEMGQKQLVDKDENREDISKD
ncbi:MAG: small, acid-soluble spore protein, alpha/beta type [Candidatus Alkaliphilus sp. MAG34]|nr:alpha/beta-type small acid-soluble spore protein [Clostridiales bacterium]